VGASWVVDALRHATDSLDYFQLMQNQSVFNFVVILVTMAMAAASFCFMNHTMFQRNVKIHKAEAALVCPTSASTMSINLLKFSHTAAYIFRDYACKTHSHQTLTSCAYQSSSTKFNLATMSPFRHRQHHTHSPPPCPSTARTCSTTVSAAMAHTSQFPQQRP
jgi:hypothetical protein